MLAGASMGAHTLVRFALEHPERAAALVVDHARLRPGPPERGLDHWDALSRGLRDGGVDGFIEAYGEPRVPEQFRDTVRTRPAPAPVGPRAPRRGRRRAAGRCRGRARSTRGTRSAALDLPVTVVACRDEADPEHPYAIGERYADAIPGARLVSEEPGKSPLAWQGGQLSRVIAETAARAAL